MTPNEKYFQHVDWVIDEAIKRGITIFLVPTWARWMNTGRVSREGVELNRRSLVRSSYHLQRGKRSVLRSLRREEISLLAQDHGR